MKLSIAWIFDHIDADWRKQDINFLMKKFNQVVAEIEGFEEVEKDLKNYALATFKSFPATESEQFTVFIPEWKKEIDLPARKDLKDFFSKKESNFACMVKKDDDKLLDLQKVYLNKKRDA